MPPSLPLRFIGIRNFQSIAAIDVDLSPVTVIVGPSNSGKSAVVRAIAAALSNPRGSHFIREGQGGCGVVFALGSDPARVSSQVIYVKRLGRGGTASTEYRVDAQAYTAVGSGVPEEITAALGIDPDLQVADQFDPPFLLTKSPSQVASALGALTRGDVLLQAIAKASAGERQNAADARTLTGLAEEAEAAAAALEWVDALDRDFKLVLPLVKKLILARERRNRAMQLLDRARPLAASLVALRAHRASVPPGLLEALTGLTDAQETLVADTGFARLRALVARVYELRAEVAGLRDYRHDLDRALPDLHDALRRAEALVPRCAACGQPVAVEDVVHSHRNDDPGKDPDEAQH